MEHSGALLCQLLGRLPEEPWPQVGWLSSGGEKLKTGIKIVQTSLKSWARFPSGSAFTWKNTYLDKQRQMSDCDISSDSEA